MSLVEKAAWVIERNLRAELSLESLAHACGVSRFHLSHAFGQREGRSVIQYLRERRLSEAARRLACEKCGVLDAALEAGYASHEAFTRAFRDLIGETPEAVKRRSDLVGLTLVDPLNQSSLPSMSLEDPRQETKAEVCFIGLEQSHKLGQTAEIPGQWSRFMARYAELDGVVDPIPWGVAFPADEDGRFRYLTAAAVAANSFAPRGFVRVRLPSQSYLVFRHGGHASLIAETVGAIWGEWLPANHIQPVEAACLERHCETFDPATGLGGVEIWAPVTR